MSANRMRERSKADRGGRGVVWIEGAEERGSEAYGVLYAAATCEAVTEETRGFLTLGLVGRIFRSSVQGRTGDA
jgi:hypothetical protein